jgi:hypothetical protein
MNYECLFIQRDASHVIFTMPVIDVKYYCVVIGHHID